MIKILVYQSFKRKEVNVCSIKESAFLRSWKIQLKIQKNLAWNSYYEHLRIIKISEQIKLANK